MLIDGAAPPRRNELPHVLAPLARRHAVRIDHATFTGDVSTLTTALERAFTPPPAAENRHPDPAKPYKPGADRPRPNLSWRDWTVDDFTLLLRDRRPSSQRIVTILDVLAEQPKIELSLTELAAATAMNRSQLRDAPEEGRGRRGRHSATGLARPDETLRTAGSGDYRCHAGESNSPDMSYSPQYSAILPPTKR